MKNKEKYDLIDISYDLEVDSGGYDFVIYYTSMEIYREFFSGSISTCSAFTKWLEEEYVPNILTEKEKAYLSAVIKPFRDRVKYITKYIYSAKEEYLLIVMYNGERMSFPTFKKETMYKGMKVYEEYTLEDLGL